MLTLPLLVLLIYSCYSSYLHTRPSLCLILKDLCHFVFQKYSISKHLAIFVAAWKCNAGDEVTVGGFKECVMMLSGELINGKLQSSPSRFRSTDVSLEDDSLFLLLS